ncbi:phage holin family protein [Candidatus Wolfebacteria bacterium]|nr:phage holin family protein [Candidatus Wolfebacteria bacterium]
MPKFVIRIFLFFLSNLAALYAAVYFVKGFEIISGIENFAVVALIFTFINIFIKPFIKLVLTPLIIITLGLASILINVIVLYFLDFISDKITIIGTEPLIYATVIIWFVNLMTGFFIKKIAE